MQQKMMVRVGKQGGGSGASRNRTFISSCALPMTLSFHSFFFLNVFNTYFNNYLLRMYDVNGDSIHLT